MKRIGTLGLLTLLTLVACDGLPTSPGSPIAFNTVWKEQYTGIYARREEAITTQARWTQVWSEIVANRSPKPPAPEVDFSTQSLILVARGETSDACRSIEIERIDANDAAYQITVRDMRLPMSCSCPAVTIQPVHIVAVPRFAAAVAATYKPVTIGSACN